MMLFSFLTVFQLFFGNEVVVNVLKKVTSFLGTWELIVKFYYGSALDWRLLLFLFAHSCLSAWFDWWGTAECVAWANSKLQSWARHGLNTIKSKLCCEQWNKICGTFNSIQIHTINLCNVEFRFEIK